MTQPDATPPPLVLNVDDHEPGRYARTRLLTRAGYRVEEAANGEAALALTVSLRPSLVLLDVNMPDIDGLEVCRRVKTDPSTCLTPILQISASAVTADQRVRGLDNGADGYLVEPVDSEVLLATVRSLLRMRQAEERLESANRALQEANIALRARETELLQANQELEQFAYAASHDLQEPLRTITAYTQLLLRRNEGRLEPESEDFATLITNAAARMQRLISDMLAYSQSTHADPVAQPVDLNAVLAAARLNLSQSLLETGAALEAGILPVVLGEETQLVAVFQNLLSNSLKYRDKHRTPVLTVTAEDRGNEWVIAVGDNGIGFEPLYAQRIFGLFKRLHSQNEYDGTGVGLSIVQRIIERHGGQVWAEGRKGEGATFYFTMRRA
jgi:two-component system, sensor histidine kinase and response regulator